MKEVLRNHEFRVEPYFVLVFAMLMMNYSLGLIKSGREALLDNSNYQAALKLSSLTSSLNQAEQALVFHPSQPTGKLLCHPDPQNIKYCTTIMAPEIFPNGVVWNQQVTQVIETGTPYIEPYIPTLSKIQIPGVNSVTTYNGLPVAETTFQAFRDSLGKVSSEMEVMRISYLQQPDIVRAQQQQALGSIGFLFSTAVTVGAGFSVLRSNKSTPQN